MKKKLATLLVSLFGVTLAGVGCTTPTQSQPSTKAADAYTLSTDTDLNYSYSSVNLTSYVAVQAGFEVKFYSDEACTQEVRPFTYTLNVGNNVVYAKISEIANKNNSYSVAITLNRAQSTSSDASTALKLNGAVYTGSKIKVASSVDKINLTNTFTVLDGYGMKVYSDAACTSELNASAVSLEPGANAVYIKVAENIDSSNSHVFSASIYRTKSYTVTLNLPEDLFPDAQPTVVKVDEKTTFSAPMPDIDTEAFGFLGWYLSDDYTTSYRSGALSENIELFAYVVENPYTKPVVFYLEDKDGTYKKDTSLTIASKAFEGAVKASDFESEVNAVTGFELKDFEKTDDNVVVRLSRKYYDVVFKYFDANGDLVSATVPTKYGLSPVAPHVPDVRKANETTDKLNGWTLDGDPCDLLIYEVVGECEFVAGYDTVSTTYTITPLSGTGYTVTLVTDPSALLKNATVKFKVELADNYSHCKDDVVVYLGDTEVTQHAGVTYTATVPGDAEIRVEGVVENTYSVTLASTFGDPNFYGVSIDDADNIGYVVDVSDMMLATATLKEYADSITVSGLRSGSHVVKFVRKSDRIVIGVKEFTINPTLLTTIDIGSVELGGIYVAGFVNNGDSYSADASKAGAGELVGIKFGDNFLLDYTVKYEPASTETSPVYGFSLSSGSDTVAFGRYEKGVYVSVNGEAYSTKIGFSANISELAASTQDIHLVRKNGFVLFFVGDNATPDFVLSSEGLVCVGGSSVISDTTLAGNLAVAMGKILAHDTVTASILAATTTASAKLYNTFTDIDYSLGAEYTEAFHDFRTISISGDAAEDVFDIGNPEYSVIIGTTKVSGVGSLDYDLASYGGTLYGKQIIIRVALDEDLEAEKDDKGVYYVQTPKHLYVTRKDSSGNVIATTDEVLGLKAISEFGDVYEYAFMANQSESYEFSFEYESIVANKAIVNLEASLYGQVLGGMNYTITDADGMVVFGGKLFRYNGYSITDIPLKAGVYKFHVEGDGQTFGGSMTFEITEDQAANNETVNFSGEDGLEIKDNIWGEPGGFTTWFDKSADDPAATYTVKFSKSGYGDSSFGLRQGIMNGQMISYTLQYNDKSADGSELANGVYPATGSLYDGNGYDQDTYIKNTVDGSNMGLSSGGAVYGAKATGASPFTTISGLFGLKLKVNSKTIEQADYNVKYDFAYLRKDNKVYFLGKYSGDENYSVISTLDVTTDVSRINLIISQRSSFYLNYQYTNLAFNDNEEEVYAVLDNAYDGTKLTAKDDEGNYNSLTLSNTYTDSKKAVIDMDALVSSATFKNGSNGLLRIGATFSIEVDIDVWGANNLSKGFYVKDETGKYVYIIPNAASDKWTVATSDTSKKITGANTNVESFSNLTSTEKFTYHAKLTITGDEYTLTYNGQQVFKLDLKEELASSKYPSGDYYTLGFYETGDGISYTQYRNVRASYVNNSDIANIEVVGAPDYGVYSLVGAKLDSCVVGMNVILRVTNAGKVVSSVTVNGDTASAKCVDYAQGVYDIPLALVLDNEVAVEWEEAKVTAPVTVTITNNTNSNYTFVCDELSFSGTAQNGVISANLPAGEWTLVIKSLDTLCGKTLTFVIPEESEDPIDMSVTLEVNEFGINGIRNFITEMTKDEDGVDVSIECMLKNDSVYYNIAPKLSNGQMIKFTYKANEGFGIDENGENKAKAADPYLKFAVGGPSADLSGDNHAMGFESTGRLYYGANTTVINSSPFTSIVDQYTANNWDVEYDIAYVRIGDVIYMLAKYGTDEKYTVLLSKDLGAGAGEAKFNLKVAVGGTKIWAKYSFLNMKYITNSAEVSAFFAAAQE